VEKFSLMLIGGEINLEEVEPGLWNSTRAEEKGD
jgi:hypothetical protein